MITTIQRNRRHRNWWAMLAVASLITAVAAIKTGFSLWSAQTTEAVETQAVNWLPGFAGFCLNIVGGLMIVNTMYCISMARKCHRRLGVLEARARNRTRPRHPTAIRA